MDVRDGQPVELAVDSVGGVLGIAVRGALVGEGTSPLRECLEQAKRSARPVVVELAEATAIDREAIDLLLDTHASLR